MKKVLGFLLIGFIGMQAFSITGNGLTKEERKAGTDYFTDTRNYFTSHVKGLSEVQLDYRAAPDKWSIRECMEHIALSEAFIFGVGYQFA